tara:strand:- start:10707 stop:11921 length:1215 start_codon:yes stop_codon:yes gene_type:complete
MKEFLDLGKQPIANGFLKQEEIASEYFFDLKVGLEEETRLVSLINPVNENKMFHENYAYRSSQSKTMLQHFLHVGEGLAKAFKPFYVLEIGSNDGAFIKNWAKSTSCAVEPCKNFAEITTSMGYKTYNSFWTQELADKILNDRGHKMDLIFSANCICHIPDLDECFKAISKILARDGVFAFQDPDLASMITKTSYDQLYDEHAHIFSVTALKNILQKYSLQIFDVVHYKNIHGGSNVIMVAHEGTRTPSQKLAKALSYEDEVGLNDEKAYFTFAKNVQQSKKELVEELSRCKDRGQKVVSYGATSKSTTVFNYCGINSELIEFIVDTTPEKIGKLSPGMHIPVKSYENFTEDIDVAFLGAWNFVSEIYEKELSWTYKGGKFFTHVPYCTYVDGEFVGQLNTFGN